MKRGMIIIMSLIVILVLSFNYVSANTTAPFVNEQESYNRYPDVCNGQPYHEMYPKAWGTASILQNGQWVEWVDYGVCYQCSGCYLVWCSQGDPLGDIIFGSTIRRWATYTAQYDIGNHSFHFIHATAHGYNPGSTQEGLRFHRF